MYTHFSKLELHNAIQRLQPAETTSKIVHCIRYHCMEGGIEELNSKRLQLKS